MIIGLAIEISTVKLVLAQDFILKVVEVDVDDIHRETIIIEHNIIILLQVSIMGSEIIGLKILVFGVYLVYCQEILIFKVE